MSANGIKPDDEIVALKRPGAVPQPLPTPWVRGVAGSYRRQMWGSQCLSECQAAAGSGTTLRRRK